MKRKTTEISRHEEIIRSKLTKKLTTLDWEVYNAIKASSEYGYPISQKDLCEAVGLDYRPDSRKNGNRALWDIVEKINSSTEVDKAIYAENYTYVLADEAQYNAMLEREKASLAKHGRRYAALAVKKSLNNQGKVLSNQLKPISGDAKEFHETYFHKILEEGKKDA